MGQIALNTQKGWKTSYLNCNNYGDNNYGGFKRGWGPVIVPGTQLSPDSWGLDGRAN